MPCWLSNDKWTGHYPPWSGWPDCENVDVHSLFHNQYQILCLWSRMNMSQTDIASLRREILSYAWTSLWIFSLLSLINSELHDIRAILLQIGAFQSSLIHLWLYWWYLAFLHAQSSPHCSQHLSVSTDCPVLGEVLFNCHRHSTTMTGASWLHFALLYYLLCTSPFPTILPTFATFNSW
jgi:hypothetical protein